MNILAKKLQNGALAVLLATAVSACSGMLESSQPAKQYYLLQPMQTAGASSDSIGQSLTLTVTAIPGLDTDHILAVRSDSGLNRYANARWPDNLPEVVGSLLQRSLAGSGQYAPVVVAPHADSGSWHLELEIQQFYGVMGSSGNTNSVEVKLAGSIQCGDSLHVVTVSDSTSVSDERLASVVAAHQSSLDSATTLLISKLSELCS